MIRLLALFKYIISRNRLQNLLENCPILSLTWVIIISTMERLKPIGREQIDALLKFLPVFEKPGLVIGGQVKGKGIMMAEWWYCEEVNEFVSRLYRDGWWLGDWDWGKWQNQARKYFERPEVIARARLLTLRKLLHLHVRKDRYCAGHLGLMFEQGHIQAILKRLEKLRDKKT